MKGTGMRVLVTGVLGYIGSILSEEILRRKHEVVGLDTGYYAAARLYATPEATPVQVLRKDVRAVTVDDLRGFDAVMHLGELSNDPLGQFNPAITYAINHHGSVRLAELCRKAGVPRFIYSSSCSVYGAGTGDFKTEESEVNPQTVYAECKVLVERDVAKLADDKFCPVFLRNATAYGASPAMRFDLVVNNLSGLAWTTREIKMTSDGTPWRPLAHIADISRAFACALEAPADAVRNQILNVGDTRENYRVREIATLVGEAFPGCKVTFGTGDKDTRSYRVNFDRIRAVLPAFACEYSAGRGASELQETFSRINMTRETFEHRAFTRMKQLEHLCRTGRIDRDFFWKSAA